MTAEEFHEIIPEESCFCIVDYRYYKDSEGNPCVAEFSAEGGYKTVTACYTFSKDSIDTSAAAFDSLEEGMTMLQVVEKVGIPIGTATSGMYTMVFPGDEGYYVIYFHGDNTVMEVRDPIDHDPSIK